MSAETASLVVQIAGAYLALGALFALAFVARTEAHEADEAAATASHPSGARCISARQSSGPSARSCRARSPH